MEKLLDRLESGERHTRENLDHLNDKVERIGGRVEELADRQPDIKARDLPGFSALEGAVRNIVDHIEKSETQDPRNHVLAAVAVVRHQRQG
jgi:localization factor PodJL